MRRFDETSHFQLRCCDEHALDVRAVRSCCDIILDSGSDATVIPIGMIAAGSPAADQPRTCVMLRVHGLRLKV